MGPFATCSCQFNRGIIYISLCTSTRPRLPNQTTSAMSTSYDRMPSVKVSDQHIISSIHYWNLFGDTNDKRSDCIAYPTWGDRATRDIFSEYEIDKYKMQVANVVSTPHRIEIMYKTTTSSRWLPRFAAGRKRDLLL